MSMSAEDAEKLQEWCGKIQTSRAIPPPPVAQNYKRQLDRSKSLDRTVPLRFEVGERVECQWGQAGRWEAGTVTRQWWTTEVYLDGNVADIPFPYQVRLDSAKLMDLPLIGISEDEDFFIRKSGAPHRCAGCGKTGERLKNCSACKSVKYCGSACQKAHRKGHKRECKVRAREIHDEVLYAIPDQPREECPICTLTLPINEDESIYVPCCGQSVCGGCLLAARVERDSTSPQSGQYPCPFCRAPSADADEESIMLLQKRVEEYSDASAMYILGAHYCQGTMGLEQDKARGIQLWKRAAELGSPKAHVKLSSIYVKEYGMDIEGVEKNEKKAIEHCEIAAMQGFIPARVCLGSLEMRAGNTRRGMKHYLMAARAGDDMSLSHLQSGFRAGDVTKEECANALRAHKKSSDEMKSAQRHCYMLSKDKSYESKMAPHELAQLRSSRDYLKMMCNAMADSGMHVPVGAQFSG